MGLLGSLEKLTIIAYENDDFSGKIGEIKVAVNPEKYTHKYKICYSAVDAIGSAGGSPKFDRFPSDKVDFELIFDGTGVIPTALPGILPGALSDTVPDQIEKFKKLVFNFNGKTHSPNFLTLSWGTLLFDCRLTDLNISYTLFKPDGTPLRAKAGASFIGYESEKRLAARAKKSSPDLSHIIIVKKGDTLPLLCHRVYKNSALYPEVAEVNDLVDFRNLTPGSQLVFPPLKD